MHKRRKRRIAKRVNAEKKRQKMEDNLIERARIEGRIRDHYKRISHEKNGYQARTWLVKGEDGIIKTGEEEVLKTWKTHFESLLNRPEPAVHVHQKIRIGADPQVPEPSQAEMKIVISRL